MNLKRILAAMLSVALLSGILPAIAKEDENTAYIELSDVAATYTPSCVKNVKMGILPTVSLTNRKGKNCWQLKSADRMSSFVNVDLNDDWVSKVSDGTVFEIEVEYYDEGTGALNLEYDSQSSPDRETDGIYLKNTLEWKKHIFAVDDAYFGNRHWNATSDFSVNVRSSKLGFSIGNVCVASVTVRKYPKYKPVQAISVKSNELGNIFANGEDRIFDVELMNYSDEKKDAEVRYIAYDDYKRNVWEQTESVSLNAGQSVTKEITPQVSRYCLYDLKVEIACDGCGLFEKTVPFSCINNPEDGSKNDYFGYCTKFHLDGYDAYEGLEVIDKSGAGFVRNSMQWEVVDPPGGARQIPPNCERMFDALNKYGIKWQWLVGMGNTKYGMPVTNTMPQTEEEISRFEDYLKYTLSEVEKRGVQMHSIEIWNEPNLQSFNSTMVNGADYAKFANRALSVIRKSNNNVTSTMGSLCNITSSATKNYFDEMLTELEPGDIDAFTFHPYNHSWLPEKGVLDDYSGYISKFEEKLGVKPKLYNTEIGYYSGSGHAADPGVQAMYNMRLYVYYKAKGYGNYFSWYNITNEGGVKTYQEHNFGHLMSHNELFTDVPYAAKEVFVADTALNKLLQNADVVSAPLETETDYAYTFLRPKDGKHITAMWTSGEPVTASFKLNTDTATLYDIYGNPTELKSDNGVFTVMLTEAMQYLEGDYSSASIVESEYGFSQTKLDIAKGSNFDLEIKGLKDGDTVELSSRIGNELSQSDGIISGVYNEEVGTDDVIKIIIKNNGHVRASFDIGITVTEAFTSSIIADILDNRDVTYWYATVYVKNNAFKQPLDVKLTFLTPSFLADNCKTIRIPTIPAGCTGEVRIKLPRINGLGMYSVEYDLERADGETVHYKQSVDFTCAMYTGKKPVIDGQMSDGEWDKMATMICNNPDNVSMLNGNRYLGEDDLSSMINIMFDKENLYVYVKVKDNIKSGTSINDLVWQNDSVQFGIAFDKRLHDTIVGGTFTEISYGDTPNGPIVWRGSSEGNSMPTGRVDNAQLAVTRQGSETHYELSIPWSEITAADIDFDNIEKIGFALLVNDNDGNGRKGWIEYAGGIARQKDPSMFTFLSVVK